jgi:hypothetical protein
MIISNSRNWIQKSKIKLVQFLDRIQMSLIFDCFVISLIVAISFFLFDPGLDSNWGLIDDHEIMLFSPVYHPMSFSDVIPTLLTKTEISPDSTSVRFRPVYYFFRLLETRLWVAKAPFLWYLARIVIFIFFIIAIYFLIKQINGRLIAVLSAMVVMSFDFWNDIFSRLGPSETYVILGLTFFLLGFLILIKKTKSNFAWVLILLGTLIAIGSKENMAILLFPEIYLYLYFSRKSHKRSLFPLISVLISSLWTIWINAILFIRLKAYGLDYYGNSIGLSYRLAILGKYISNNSFLFVFIGVLLVIGVVGLVFFRSEKAKPLFINLMFCSMYILLLISSQQYFYSGVLRGRYYIPYALYLPFLISIAAYVLQNPPFFTNKIYYHLITLTISVAVLILFFHPASFFTLRKTSTVNSIVTNNFAVKIDDINYYLSKNKDTSVVFYGNNPGSDFEGIVSYTRFIRSDGFSGNVFIFRDPPLDYETSFSKLDAMLEKQLALWSQNGNAEEGITPLSQYSRNSTKCLLISFSATHPSSIHCGSVVNN